MSNFRRKLEGFIRGRPREWVQMMSFRCVELNSDLDYVEYLLVLQHKLPWQNLAAIVESKSVVVSYATRLQHQMGIMYGGRVRSPGAPQHSLARVGEKREKGT